MINNLDTPNSSTSKPADLASSAIEKGMVLLVEDHEMIRTVVDSFLKKEGYEVLNAVDGDKGLEIFQRNVDKIDLVITDVMMPGMNGSDLANRIREQDPEMKIIFISGYSNSLVSQDVLANPNVRFMKKPFSFGDLRKTIGELLLV